jgi:hypothetical protein
MKKGLAILITSLLLGLFNLLPASTALAAPPAPTLVYPLNGGMVTMTPTTFDWTDVVAVPPVNLYLITVANNPGFTSPMQGTPAISNYTFPVPLTPGQQWWWYVQASDDGGLTWGPPSATWSFYIQSAAISVNPYQGYFGTTVTIYGYGWVPGETVRVYYDGIFQQVLVPAGGGWTLIIPASGAMGYHTITAVGTYSGTQTASFRITGPPGYITQSTTQGSPGASVTITGYNFNSRESIFVTFGGSVVAQGVADYTGYWTFPFIVPERPAGSYTIDAYGSITSAAGIANLSFWLVPGVSVSPTSLKGQEQIVINGKGFQPLSAINLSYDRTSFTTASNSLGSFSMTKTAPNKGGSYTITAADASGNSASATFTIINPISVIISPTTGAVGEEVVISGSSQTPGTVTIAYDGLNIGTTKTSGDDSFIFSFRIPKSTAGYHNLTVTDDIGNSASATFSVESSPPPVPMPIKPEYGSRAGWSQSVTFSWGAVSDPSGVVYNLLAYDSALREVLNISGITAPSYKANLPSQGAFSWSVQAVDGAGNASAWSDPAYFVVGPPIPVWAMVLLGVLAVLLAGALYYFIKVWQPSPPQRRKGKAGKVKKAEGVRIVVAAITVSGPVKTADLVKKVTKEVAKQLPKGRGK